MQAGKSVTSKNKNKVWYPHDQFFRTAMSDKRVAKEFLKAHLPKALSKAVDFDALVLEPRHYVSEVRQAAVVDVLFKTKLDGHESYVFLLLEHQSTPDKLMPFRMLKYMCNIIDEHLRKHKTAKIPLIYPLVVYHGRRPYPFSTAIYDLVDAPKALVDAYFLKPFQLIDLGQIEDDVLRQKAWSGVMAFVLKHIFSRDLLPHLKVLMPLLHQLVGENGREHVEIVLQYVLEQGDIGDKEAFFQLVDERVSHEVGEKIMSLGKVLREEGKLEGLQEGKLEGLQEGKWQVARKMLIEGVEPVFIAKVTGLSLKVIQRISTE